MPFRLILASLLVAVATASAKAPPKLTPEEEGKCKELFNFRYMKAMQEMGSGNFAGALEPMQDIHAGLQKIFTKERFPDGSAILGSAICNHGFILLNLGRTAEAAPLLEEGWKMLSSQVGPDSDGDAKTMLYGHYFSMAELRSAQGRHAAAVEFLERQHAFITKELESRGTKDDPLATVSLVAICEIHVRTGDLPAARKALDRAIAVKAPHADKTAMYDFKFWVARKISAAGAPAIAAELIDPVVAETRKSSANPLDLDAQTRLAMVLMLKAYIEDDGGNQDACRAAGIEALAIHERLYPPALVPNGDPQVAEIRGFIAHSHEGQDRFDLAAVEYRKAVAIYRKLYPPQSHPSGHRQTSVALHNLGMNQLSAGHLEEAFVLLREAQAMKKALYAGANSPDGNRELIASSEVVAMCLSEMGKHAEANTAQADTRALLEKAFPEQLFPNGNAVKLSMYHGVVECLLRAGKWPEALNLSERRLAWAKPENRGVLRANPLTLAEAFHQHGEICLKFGKWSDARAAFKEALKIMDASPRVERAKPVSPYIELETASYLAGIALILKDSADMTAMHKRATDLLQRMTAEREPTRTMAKRLDKIADYWREQGQKEMATALHQASRSIWAKVCGRYPSPENRAGAKANLESLATAFEKAGKAAEAGKFAAEAAAIPR